MSLTNRALRAACLIAAVLTLAGCGGGEVGGTVSGLGSGRSVVLLNNGADALTVRANGRFAFADLLSANSAYAVTVGTQPSGQTCSVANGNGTIDAERTSIDDVQVSCSFVAALRGTLSGLRAGTALTLANGSERLAVSANGAFAFSTTLAEGTAYSVSIVAQPAIGSCRVDNASGSFFAASFSDVLVICE
jgi:hypothetical protein